MPLRRTNECPACLAWCDQQTVIHRALKLPFAVSEAECADLILMEYRQMTNSAGKYAHISATTTSAVAPALMIGLGCSVGARADEAAAADSVASAGPPLVELDAANLTEQ